MRSRRTVLPAIGQEAAGSGGRGGDRTADVTAATSPAARPLYAAGLAGYAAGVCRGHAAVFLWPNDFELIQDGARHEAVIEDVSGRRR